MGSWSNRSILAGLTLLALYGSGARAAEVDLDPPYANRYRTWQTTARITNATIGVSALSTPILLVNHLPMLGLTGSLLAFSIGTELQLRANARAVRPLASPTSPWPP